MVAFAFRLRRLGVPGRLRLALACIPALTTPAAPTRNPFCWNIVRRSKLTVIELWIQWTSRLMAKPLQTNAHCHERSCARQSAFVWKHSTSNHHQHIRQINSQDDCHHCLFEQQILHTFSCLNAHFMCTFRAQTHTPAIFLERGRACLSMCTSETSMRNNAIQQSISDDVPPILVMKRSTKSRCINSFASGGSRHQFWVNALEAEKNWRIVLGDQSAGQHTLLRSALCPFGGKCDTYRKISLQSDLIQNVRTPTLYSWLLLADAVLQRTTRLS